MNTFKIFLPRRVRGDWPIGHHLVAEEGVHVAVRNPLGAVAVILPNGEYLGIKPGEYEEVN